MDYFMQEVGKMASQQQAMAADVKKLQV